MKLGYMIAVMMPLFTHGCPTCVGLASENSTAYFLIDHAPTEQDTIQASAPDIDDDQKELL